MTTASVLELLTKLLGIRVMHLKDVAPIEIATPRLRLRSFRVFEDWPRYREYHRDPEVTRHLAVRPDTDDKLRAELKAYAAITQALPGHLHLGIQRAGDGRLLGQIHVTPDRSSKDRGILGFLLHRDAWGQGIATEAARAMVDHGFRVLPYREIWAGCTRENVASRRVLGKIGLSPTAKTVVFPGEPEGAETIAFGVDRATWMKGAEAR